MIVELYRHRQRKSQCLTCWPGSAVKAVRRALARPSQKKYMVSSTELMNKESVAVRREHLAGPDRNLAIAPLKRAESDSMYIIICRAWCRPTSGGTEFSYTERNGIHRE